MHGDPYLDEYDCTQDAFLEGYSDDIYHMVPTNIISYIYGGHDHSVTQVQYELQSHSHGNTLDIKILEPKNLLSVN